MQAATDRSATATGGTDSYAMREHLAPGRVWECMGWGGEANQNSGFAPSITLPLGVLCQ
ncbi:MAG: hypothetical protein WCS01_14240 [bacterium]